MRRRTGQIEVDAIHAYIRGFPTWFTYSPAAPAVRAVLGRQARNDLLSRSHAQI